ncbi:MAG TPA: hypothetical protein VLC09_22035, partial [Polyangiaceae bacterium]|nr:hypothetical protein [Polyangiaceae bacterium]
MQIRNGPVALLLCLAALGTFVVAPRPTRPIVLPLPQVDASRLHSREEDEQRLAREARATELSLEMRTIGEEFRRLNAALASGAATGPALAAQLREDVAVAVHAGQTAQLRQLRALQSELFLAALREFWPAGGARRGAAPAEFIELAGSFERVALASFVDDDGRLLLRDDDLRLMFRVHW